MVVYQQKAGIVVRMLHNCIQQVNNTSSDPPDNANNGGVQYLNVTNIMALTNERDDDNNRASDNQHEVCTYMHIIAMHFSF